MCYANIFARSSSFSNHTRLRNVKEANNSFVFDWEGGLLGIYRQGQLIIEVRWTHMQKVIRPLSLRESRFCYCCIGVLLPFNTFEVISGAVNYYNHTVLGQSPRLSAYYDRRNRFMTNLRKRKKYMFHFDEQSPQKYVAECEDRIRDRSHAGTVERASNRDTALGKRERERESFLLCDSSRSLESLYFT